MDTQRVIFTPKVEVTFTPEEVEVMMLMSKHHYDSSCKLASQKGGILFGISNCIEWGNICTLTMNDIDLLAKICEGYPHFNPGLGGKLYREFIQCLDMLNEKYRSVNS